MRQIELYVPTQDNQGQPIPDRNWDQLHSALFTMGDGFTEYPAYGCWRDSTGRPISEDVFVYRMVTDDPFAEANIRTIATFVKEHWRQESVLYTVQDVQATFI